MRISLAIGVVMVMGLMLVPGVSGKSGPGGGLTVKQARASKLTGVLLVRGFVLVDRGGRVRLCARLVGTPPACGGASLLVSGAAAAQLGRLKRAQGVAWSRRPQGVFGRMRHGRLIFASHVI
jgi:hypothetical protein